jgi:hypothetical protein
MLLSSLQYLHVLHIILVTLSSRASVASRGIPPAHQPALACHKPSPIFRYYTLASPRREKRVLGRLEKNQPFPERSLWGVRGTR